MLPGVHVGKGAVVKHCILDKNVQVAPGEVIGVDSENDKARFNVSAGGVVIVGKNETIGTLED